MRHSQLAVSILSALIGVVLAAGSGAELPQALPWVVASSACFALCLSQLFHSGARNAENEKKVKSPVVSHGLTKYEHKVGGHTSPDGLDVCILNNNFAEVLKRLQPQPYTMRELTFYREEMPKHQDGLLRSVIEYLPKFHGVYEVDNMSYLRLQNLMLAYSKPCILDVKIGRRCYELSAPEDKKQRERNKYPYQESIGFRVAGLKVWKEEEKSFFEEIRQGKNRTEEDMLRGVDIEKYLMGCHSPEHRTEVVEQLEDHLVSLLFAYEGDPNVNAENRVLPKVWLVDFSHTISGCDAVDENFAFGLQTFRRVFGRFKESSN